MARIVLEHVSKQFSAGTAAVNDVSLTVEDGEFMVLVGPSGCGKTTILRMIAGLEEVTAGELYIGERVMTDASPKDRDVAMVFQNYALYPHMTVEQNIGFGLKLRHTPRGEAKRRVEDVARVLALEPYLKRKPAELSGGQRQRVAMGRAIVREPQAFLMDEPLSNLDAKLRVQMRAELARIHQRLGTTTVYVTHDQVEAMTLGDRVAVLRDGYLQQVATPTELFSRPANMFVAAFIGSPSMNLIEAHIEGRRVVFGSHSAPLPEWAVGEVDGDVVLGIRPSDMEDADLAHGAATAQMEVTAEVIEELGSEINVLFHLDAKAAVTEETLAAASDEGTAGATAPLATLAEGAGGTFTARVDARSKVRRGQRLNLVLDPERFHFFDQESGQAVRSEERRSAAVG